MFTLLQAAVTDSIAGAMPTELAKPDFWAKVLPKAEIWGAKLLVVVLIILIGNWISKIIANFMRKALNKKEGNETLAAFLSSIVYFILMVFVVIAAINKLGVQTTSFVAIIAASGLAIGLALQGSLANFAGGVMLVLYKPFRVGHTITGAGQTGKVHEIQMFCTVLKDADGKAIIIPNGKLSNDIIVNFEGVDKL
jgi:small conductance mechanosensitive channel